MLGRGSSDGLSDADTAVVPLKPQHDTPNVRPSITDGILSKSAAVAAICERNRAYWQIGQALYNRAAASWRARGH